MNKRIEDIECLRAVAVIAVVIHHANGNLFTALSPGLATFYPIFLSCLAQNHASACSIKLFV